MLLEKEEKRKKGCWIIKLCDPLCTSTVHEFFLYSSPSRIAYFPLLENIVLPSVQCELLFWFQDRNDIPPVYTAVPRPVTLNDDVPIGTTVTTLIATDSDGTSPGNKVYTTFKRVQYQSSNRITHLSICWFSYLLTVLYMSFLESDTCQWITHTSVIREFIWPSTYLPS